MTRDLYRAPVVASVTLALIIGYVLTLGADYVIGRLIGSHPFAEFREFAILLFAVLYSIHRAVIFHPQCNYRYGQWLVTTPWTPDQPFPLGPIHFGAHDAFILVVLLALALAQSVFDPGAFMLVDALTAVTLCFAVPYLAILCVCAAASKRSIPLYVMLLTAPLVWYSAFNPYAAICVVALVYATWFIDFRIYLRQTPTLGLAESLDWSRRNVGNKLEKGRVVGWPYSYLLGLKYFTAQELTVAGLHSALLTWWYAATIRLLDDELGIFLFMWSAILAMIRLAIYTGYRRAPLSLWARLFTGRLIIPRYDQVFIVPLLVLGTGAVLPRVLMTVGGQPAAAYHFTLFTILWIAFAFPPTLRTWRLTGAHCVTTAFRRQVKGL